MAKEPSVTVTLRVPETVRELLRAAAEKDHRSMANMLEVLILKHCEANSILVSLSRQAMKSDARRERRSNKPR